MKRETMMATGSGDQSVSDPLAALTVISATICMPSHAYLQVKLLGKKLVDWNRLMSHREAHFVCVDDLTSTQINDV